MKWVVLGAIAATLCLSGCNKPRDAVEGGGDSHGRYAGVGIYPAGRIWAQMVAPKAAKDSLANLHDDEQVIVVVDSRTGEVRQCGNMTGYCIGMNPWAGPLPAPQGAPVQVLKHGAELDADAEAAAAARDAPAARREAEAAARDAEKKAPAKAP
jgi:hypothetical protein